MGKRIILAIFALGLLSLSIVFLVTGCNTNPGQVSPNDATTTAVVATTNAESTLISSNGATLNAAATCVATFTAVIATLNAVATPISFNGATPNAVATQISAVATLISAESTQTSSCGR